MAASKARVLWAVFDSDGYECSDFIGAFDTEAQAGEVAEKVRESYREAYAKFFEDEWPGTVSVLPRRINEWDGSVIARNKHLAEAGPEYRKARRAAVSEAKTKHQSRDERGEE